MTFFYRMTWLALLLSLAMTVLSAGIRLSESGIGCEPWPACYAGQYAIDSEPGIAIAAEDPRRGFRMLHRIMASAFAVVVLVMTTVSLWYRSRLGVSPLLPVTCFALTVALSIVGIKTPDVVHPVVTAINLTGGMLLAALLWQLMTVQREGRATRSPRGMFAWLSLASVVAVLLVIASGSWVSGNFAVTACDGILACSSMGQASFAAAFDPGRELAIEAGRMVLGAEQALIGFVHHGLAIVLFVLVIAAAVAGWRKARPVAITSSVLAVLLMISGLVETAAPSIPSANLHNFLSLVLMLTLIHQYNRSTRESHD